MGSGSHLDDLIELSGGRNVAARAEGSVLFTPEELIRSDPDVILHVDGFATPASIAGRPGLKDLSAVRRGRIHAIDRYWLVPGASLPESVAVLRAALEGTTR